MKPRAAEGRDSLDRDLDSMNPLVGFSPRSEGSHSARVAAARDVSLEGSRGASGWESGAERAGVTPLH